MIRCTQCASLVAAGLDRCKACGTPTVPSPQPPTPGPPNAVPPLDQDAAGATIFRGGHSFDAPVVTGVPVAEPVPIAPRPGRGRLIGFGFAGGSLLVLLVAGTTTVIARGGATSSTTSPSSTTSSSTTTQVTTAPQPPPRARLAAPSPGTVIGREGAPSALVSVSVAVDGDASQVKQVIVLVDNVPQPAQPQFAAPILVQVGPGPHVLSAKVVTDAGESPASEAVPIEIKDPKPGTCGELCFHSSPELYRRPVPDANSATFGFAPATVVVVCQQQGGVYEGNQVWWDKLSDGYWVADQHLDTPKPAPASEIPRC